MRAHSVDIHRIIFLHIQQRECGRILLFRAQSRRTHSEEILAIILRQMNAARSLPSSRMKSRCFPLDSA